jgi:hypothetical protein
MKREYQEWKQSLASHQRTHPTQINNKQLKLKYKQNKLQCLDKLIVYRVTLYVDIHVLYFL